MEQTSSPHCGNGHIVLWALQRSFLYILGTLSHPLANHPSASLLLSSEDCISSVSSALGLTDPLTILHASVTQNGMPLQLRQSSNGGAASVFPDINHPLMQNKHLWKAAIKDYICTCHTRWQHPSCVHPSASQFLLQTLSYFVDNNKLISKS